MTVLFTQRGVGSRSGRRVAVVDPVADVERSRRRHIRGDIRLGAAEPAEVDELVGTYLIRFVASVALIPPVDSDRSLGARSDAARQKHLLFTGRKI